MSSTINSIQGVQLLEICVYYSRNSSSESELSETGSLDRAMTTLERRRKAAIEGAPQAPVEVTRLFPESVIDEILRSVNLEEDESGTSTITSSWKDGGFLSLFNCFNVKRIMT